MYARAQEGDDLGGLEAGVCETFEDLVRGVFDSHQISRTQKQEKKKYTLKGSGTRKLIDGCVAFLRPRRNSRRGAPGQLLRPTAPANWMLLAIRS